MKDSIKPIYRQLEERYVKIAWTHKIHECQSDIYEDKHNCIKKWMACITSITSSSAVVTVITTTFFPEIVRPWIMPVITTIFSVISSFLTILFKDATYLERAKVNKAHAAKCHDMRNKYESALADIYSNSQIDDEAVISIRNILEEKENILYSSDSVPHTSWEAVKRARASLMGNRDSQTEDEEIRAIVPQHLQIL